MPLSQFITADGVGPAQSGAGPADDRSPVSSTVVDAARRVVGSHPDAVVVIDPGAPMDRTRWGLSVAERLCADVPGTGSPSITRIARGAPQQAYELARAADEEGVSVFHPKLMRVSAFAAASLTQILRAGWRGPTLLVALPQLLRGSQADFARALARAAGVECWSVVLP